jgi:hypothetical protein
MTNAANADANYFAATYLSYQIGQPAAHVASGLVGEIAYVTDDCWVGIREADGCVAEVEASQVVELSDRDSIRPRG